MNELLRKIKNPLIDDRDLLIDDLADFIENGTCNENEQILIVDELLLIFDSENDPDICESILSLAYDIYDKGIAKEAIVNAVLRNMDRMSISGLLHSIHIIAAEDFHDKSELLRKLSLSSSAAVREAVAEAQGNLGGQG